MNAKRVVVVSLAAMAALALLAAVSACAPSGKQTTSAVPSTSAAPPGGLAFRGNGFLLSALGMDLDMITSALQAAVDLGTMTQQQASEVWEWWRQKPDFLTEALFTRNTTRLPRPSITPSPDFTGVPQRQGGFALAALAASLDILNSSLKNAVQEGTLNEDQAARTREWWQQKPAFLSETMFPTGTPPTGLPFTRPSP
jgi:hypothetical protein